MRGLRHPFSGACYEWVDDDGPGPVLVTAADGTRGRFDRDGRWLGGDLRHADAALCRWIVSGGPSRSSPGSRSRRFEAQP